MTNPFFLVILIALLVEYTAGVLVNLLNTRSLGAELPPTLSGLYKPEDYRRCQEYTRANTRLHIVLSTFSLVVLLAFWFSGGFNHLDQSIRSLGLHHISNGLLYIGTLITGDSLIRLPFSIYRMFVIEERYGFNRTTRRTFVIDILKSAALAALIGTPLLAAILALFEYAGRYAWIYCWGAVTLFSLFLQYVAPTWIMPLFNKFTPLEPGELKEAIVSYARSVDFPVSNVFVMDGSRRSGKANAFFTGFGRNKKIALFDTLIKNHTLPELVAILAHEIGHHKKRHVLIGMVIGVIHAGVLFLLLSILLGIPGLYEAFGMEQRSVYSGLLFFGLLYTPLEMVLSIVLYALSRRNEYEADRFAAATISDPRHLVAALKRLHAGNLSNPMPHPAYVLLNYSHPPLLQRMRAIMPHGT